MQNMIDADFCTLLDFINKTIFLSNQYLVNNIVPTIILTETQNALSILNYIQYAVNIYSALWTDVYRQTNSRSVSDSIVMMSVGSISIIVRGYEGMGENYLLIPCTRECCRL